MIVEKQRDEKEPDSRAAFVLLYRRAVRVDDVD